MSENNLGTKKAVCDAALALLRQDIGYKSQVSDAHVSDSVSAKCDNVWSLAYENVWQAHDWHTWPARTTSGTPATTTEPIPNDQYLRQLLVYSLARELAIPVTGRQEDLKTVDALYNSKLKVAIAKDLQEEMDALRSSDGKDDKFAVDVLDLLRQYYSVADGDMGNGHPKPQPRGIAHLVAHINSIKEKIRYEVLTTHDWSFATDEDRVISRPLPDGRFATPVPGGSVKVVKCYSGECEKSETFIRHDDVLVTRRPICRVVYLFDDGGTDSWSETAKRAYLYRVVLAVAYANPELFANPARIRQLEERVREITQDARTTDARQTHVATSAYGRNYLYDVATGRRRAKWLGHNPWRASRW